MTADHIDRAAHIIREMRQQQHSAEMIARALDAAGLLATEVWREVPGYEGRYEVSDLGNVRSWMAERDAAVAAAALRDAADEWHEEMAGTAPRPHRWLYARAARIEREAGESDADA